MENATADTPAPASLSMASSPRWMLWGELEYKLDMVMLQEGGDRWYVVVFKEGRIAAYNKTSWERKTASGEITPYQVAALFEIDRNGLWCAAVFPRNGWLAGDIRRTVKKAEAHSEETPAEQTDAASD